MKKLLLLGFMLSASFVNAQVLQEENFNALAAGDVGTDITGAVAGKGGFFTFASANAGTTTNAGNNNFEIVPVTLIGDTRVNVFTLDGPNGNSGSRFMWKDGLATAWGTRTTGYDLLAVSVDINPGTRGTSENSFGVRVYDKDSKILVGFTVDSNTGELLLLAFSGETGNQKNYIYGLGTETSPDGVFLPANVWSKIDIAFDSATGEVVIAFPGGILGLQGAAASLIPLEVDFVAASSTISANNAAGATMSFDNL